MRKHRPFLERFWSKVERSGENDCWLWTGERLGSSPYGEISHGRINKHISVHRLAFKIAHGPFDERLCVLHRCDVPLCVNPAHLFLGTLADNNEDMAKKWRSGRSKVSAEQVKEMFRLRSRGIPVAGIARMFAISPQAAHAILNREAYKYLEIS